MHACLETSGMAKNDNKRRDHFQPHRTSLQLRSHTKPKKGAGKFELGPEE